MGTGQRLDEVVQQREIGYQYEYLSVAALAR
jgi:hypothetical protein